MSTTGAATTERAGGMGSVKVAWPAAAMILLSWLWAFNAFAQYWIYFEQYAYGWLVPFLGGFFFWRRLSLYATKNGVAAIQGRPRDNLKGVVLLILLAACVVPLEFARQKSPLSRSLVLLIGLNAGIVTLLCLGWMGGRKLRREMLFPTMFFLMAAPWVSAIEQPVTAGLAEKVSAVITEIMHWLGIHAQRNGVTITMKPGPVGVDEACSGIRSLQSGLMYGVALGELFLLSVPRRMLMVVAAFVFAVLLNICRTFILCWQVDAKGMDILEKIHDPVGGAMSMILPVMIFGAAWVLRKEEIALGGPGKTALTVVSRPVARANLLRFALVVLVGGFIATNGWFWYEALKVPEVTQPNLVVRNTVTKLEVPQATLDLLKPDPEIKHYLRLKSSALGEQEIGGYYFFWLPNAANVYLLGHRPDVCMAGVGWRKDGDVEVVKIPVSGQEMTFYKFPWKRGDLKAIQLWGVWRNGKTVEINYRELDTAAPVSWLEMSGKRGSATELVSINIPYEGTPPDLKAMTEAMNNLVEHRLPATGK